MDTQTIIQGINGNCGDLARIGIITVSDRASSGEYQDEGGPAILQFFKEAIVSPLEINYSCIADEQTMIEREIIQMCDDLGCSVVVTTGGTGPASRDVTPEATAAVCDLSLIHI